MESLLGAAAQCTLYFSPWLGGFQGEQILVIYYFDMRSAKITDYVLTIVLKTCKKSSSERVPSPDILAIYFKKIYS